MAERSWLKTKYYPVHTGLRVIFDDPSGSKGCCVAYREYNSSGSFPVQGDKISIFVEQGFRVVSVKRQRKKITEEAVLNLIAEARRLHAVEIKQRLAL